MPRKRPRRHGGAAAKPEAQSHRGIDGRGGCGVKYLSAALRAVVPAVGVAGAPTCKYHPSCSQYAADALRKYGPVKGSLKTAWRLLRCNPWSRGGVDYA
jgi:putative membrane protein insertion efficiency factor